MPGFNISGRGPWPCYVYMHGLDWYGQVVRTEVREATNGSINIDYDIDGNIIGVEILDAVRVIAGKRGKIVYEYVEGIGGYVEESE